MIAVGLLGAAAGAAVAAAVLRLRLAGHHPSLVRTNVEGRPVPAVAGDAAVAGALTGAAVALVGSVAGGARAVEVEADVLVAFAVALGVMWAAGAWDDRRGAERARGFRGHLGALRRLQATGGLMKVLAGGVAGAAAGALAFGGWAIVEAALLVALGANLVNLLDRAPGRAAKVVLVAGVVVAVLGDPAWALAAAGMLAAVAVLLPADLGQRAMLGDAGANPLGAALGLGLALAAGRPGRIAAIVVLVALTAASERWSFSAAIARIRLLRVLDQLGRRSPSRGPDPQ